MPNESAGNAALVSPRHEPDHDTARAGQAKDLRERQNPEPGRRTQRKQKSADLSAPSRQARKTAVGAYYSCHPDFD